MLPQLKVYEINYEFIINNYLDVNLWDKTWNLFVYKEHMFQLRLSRIYTQTRRISFEIKKNGYYHTETIDYDINNTSIKILKQQINGAIFRVITDYEESLIRGTVEYNRIQDSMELERERLREIATDFLDNEGVTNDDIREAYIDKFVSNQETGWSKLNIYKNSMKYTILPDLYIVFCKITNDKDRLHTVMKSIGSRGTIKNIMTEVNDFIKELETDEYYNNMSEGLEAI